MVGWPITSRISTKTTNVVDTLYLGNSVGVCMEGVLPSLCAFYGTSMYTHEENFASFDPPPMVHCISDTHAQSSLNDGAKQNRLPYL